MLYSGRYTALLDSNVLYPAPLRDLLLNLAFKSLYRPKWSRDIQEEWRSHLLKNRPDLSSERIQRTIDKMNDAFQDAQVEDYQQLIPGLTLPDPGDCHVLAAAIQARADAIITYNLADFPQNYLDSFEIEAVHPDQFICSIIDLEPSISLESLITQATRLRLPPQTIDDLLDTLERIGIVNSVQIFRQYLKT